MKLTTTNNKDGSQTLYVNGKKDMRGTALEVVLRMEQLQKPALLSTESEKLFRELATDAPNWSGEPMLGGNVNSDAALRGNITDLKKKGFITTFRDEGNTFVQFTEAGQNLAASMGIEL